VIRPVLFLAASIALVACTVVPYGSATGATTEPQRAEQVVVLVGTVGAMTLMAPGQRGSLRPLGGVGLPPDAAWLSGGGSTLLVTTLAGRTVLGMAIPGASGAGSLGGLAWSPAPGDLGASHRLRAFGSLEPEPAAGSATGIDARPVAFVEGDPGSGAAGRLVVGTLAGVEARQFDLRRAAESAPAWLPDGRIVVVVRDQADRPVAQLVDPGNGRLASVGPAALRSVAIGGATVATIGDDDALRSSTVVMWLRGEPGEPIALSGADEPVIQAQPSIAGDELALVVADQAGDAASIRILAEAGGWHEIARFELPPGANRAVVGWIVAP
jgi:hypothetical protein